MDKRSKKYYDKAMNYYEKGKIYKALDICELALSESLRNPAILNLKGLLLYQKGDLSEAITVWKINKDFNDDSIARNYIKDVQADKERLDLYKLGEIQLKQLKIDSAIELFKKCAESDFNVIKVNTALALCYQKKGDFKSAQEHIRKVLSIDENANVANAIKKELQEVGEYKEQKNTSSKKVIILSGIFLTICMLFGVYIIERFKYSKSYNNYEQVNENQNLNEEIINEAQNEVQDESKENTSNSQMRDDKQTNNIYFDEKKIADLINKEDFDGIYQELSNLKEDDLKEENKQVYEQGIDLLNKKGCKKFYEDGLWYFNNKDYDNAEIQLNKAYEYCNGSYLKQHIMYYKANTLLQKEDKLGALKAYEDYYEQYPKDVYTQGALYQLALLDNDIDKQKSKIYASTLINNYPGSIYINDYIVNIVNN